MRNILVTGANKGIGLAVVEESLRRHADVQMLLCSRDPARGEQALATLIQRDASWRDRVSAVTLDVADEESVRRARGTLLAQQPNLTLHGIVNNAGLGLGTVAQTIDVNLLGIHHVCEAFAPLVGPGGRIVNVTSASAANFVANCSPERRAFFTDPDISWTQLADFVRTCGELEPARLAEFGFMSDSPYGFSKACANSYTLWLARQHPALYVNACTPGFIETDLGKEFLGTRSPAEAGMRPASEGAHVILELLFGQPRGTGHYYGSDALRSPMDRYRAPGSAEFTDRD
ncbi:SDR family NAD(P)-dependent oxidoreductase [Halioglobus maricola]|uniref:SDR family NAD(P)-dependent oxidoreductase n=1 Tax=Halioglobus maricola TaxID=2601894 RepID=A0A5P9NKC7_9GAMM|nr:SDR family NAD(P)-dependent oxidoreductase [Halioglobus maricola]QFU75936.1 SDR family NAD(P)-dependent oxidoreductase [Halioglobus maricola]